jgi:single-stranded DNA-binding protein
MLRFIGFGYVARDPQVSQTTQGSPFLPLAIRYRPEKQGADPLWIRATIWGSKGKQIANDLKKDDCVFFDGILQNYDKKGSFVDIKVESVMKIDGKPDPTTAIDKAMAANTI